MRNFLSSAVHCDDNGCLIAVCAQVANKPLECVVGAHRVYLAKAPPGVRSLCIGGTCPPALPVKWGGGVYVQARF